MEHHEFRGSPGSPSRQIGEVELLVPRTFRYQGYECAAWWQEVACEPQVVELKSNGYYVSWSFTGVVEDAYFGSLYCGVPIGKYEKSRDVGREAQHYFSPYAYAFAQSRAEGKLNADMEFNLNSEVGIGSKVVDSFCRPGEKHTLYYLTVSEEVTA